MSEEEKTEENELPKLSAKWDLFVANLFIEKFNQTKAYLATYPNVTEFTARVNGSKLLTNTNIQAHIAARFKEIHMAEDEAKAILSDQARGSIGVFFKPIDEWMFYPLPTHEILDAKEVEDESTDPPKKRIMYRVRHLALDIDKVTDPKYAHLIKKFQDKGKDGMSIELHDPQNAIDKILRVQGAYKDKVAVTDPDGQPLGTNIIRIMQHVSEKVE